MANRTNSSSNACPEFEENFILFHYGDLVGAERQKLENHLAGCTGCAGYLKELATLLPLTAKTDQPPQEFWLNYNRELRHRLDGAVEGKAWWRNLATVFQPRYLPAFATAAVVVLALTFTLGKGLWSAKNNAQDDELAEALPVAENLEFFSAMDILDDLDLLEFMGSQGNNAA